MKTIYKIYFPAISEFCTNQRQEDGYGQRIVSKYKDFICKSIYQSTNKNIRETARLMGLTVEETRQILDR